MFKNIKFQINLKPDFDDPLYETYFINKYVFNTQNTENTTIEYSKLKNVNISDDLCVTYRGSNYITQQYSSDFCFN